jgi:transglutaminase-like putative cysteine protease
MKWYKTVLFYVSCFLLSVSTTFGNDLASLIRNSGDANHYPGKSELILFDSTSIDVMASGLSYVYIHRLIKILTPQGAKKNAVVTFDYDPLSAWVEIQGVTIYRKNGRVEQLDVTKVLDYPAPARAIYWGASEKMLEVGRLEPGDALEVFLFRKGFTYALLQDGPDDERYIPPMRGHFYDIVEFWSAEPVLEKVYQVKIPTDKTLQYEFYHGEVKTSAWLDGAKMVYTFSKSNFSEPVREPDMVHPSDEFPKLLLSTSADWYAKSVWFYGVNENFGSFESTPEIDSKVAEILKPAKNEMDSISLLTHWVADNIRYSGLSMGEGEGYTLHTGNMTYTDRCGVCKDKAGLLVAMLRTAGFESYAAMTMAGSRIDYIPADQFNHSITVVRISDGSFLLLDPTWVPFVRELWSSLEQQQNYLTGLPEGDDLRITPISAPENHYLKISGESVLSSEGMLSGTIVIEAEGQSDAAIRRIFTSDYIASWNRNLERELLSVHPRIRILEMDYGNPYDYLTDPLTIYILYEIPDFAIITDREIIFTPFAATSVFSRAMSHLNLNTGVNQRTYEFRDRCSRQVMLSETTMLPVLANAGYLPQVSMVSGTGASFKGTYVLEEDKMIFSGNFKFKKRIYQPEDWDSVKEAVLIHKKVSEEPVILKKYNQ